MPQSKHIIYFEKLKVDLPESSAADRRTLAAQLVDEKISIKSLSDLLFEDVKIASRFLWLLTDIAEIDSEKLKKDLVHLFDLCQTLDQIRLEPSFANYWLICGVPEEKEAEYIDFLFEWLSSNESNITTKSRSMFVLQNLARKYPDLRIELKTRIHEQLDRNTDSFRIRAKKVLAQLAS
ncbi:MAG: hypothetical protein P8P74_18025 [Crocinitomicaceae bacterium]|nr:hypothetical protein [Crocinitomicaceae bacterium]